MWRNKSTRLKAAGIDPLVVKRTKETETKQAGINTGEKCKMQQTWIPSQPEKLTPRHGTGGNSQTFTRLLKIVYILYSVEAGIFLLWLPWMSFWDTNYLTYAYPQILPVITNPFFKGGVLGLGIVNLMIGIHEVVHFKKLAKGFFQR